MATEEALEQERANREELTRMVDEANRASAAAAQECTNLRTSLDGVREELVVTRAENDRLQQNLRALQTESVSLAGQSELILSQKAALEERVHALSAILSETMEEAENGKRMELAAQTEQHRAFCEVQSAKLSSLEQETLALKAQLHAAHSAHSAAVAARQGGGGDGDDGGSGVLATLQHEVQRLSCEVERLTLDVNLKDADLHAAALAANKRDGELAGLRATLEGVTEDVQALKHENDDFARRLAAETRRAKEVTRERDALLQRATGPGQGQWQGQEHGPLLGTGSDEAARAVLVGLLTYVEGKRGDVLSGLHGAADIAADTWADTPLSDLAQRCRASAEAAVAALEARAAHAAHAAAQDAARGPASLLTPSRPTAANAFVAASLTGGGGGGGGTPNTVGAAGKEAARLLMEINRERRRFAELQEQHSDLLGLLAQQEVELGVFRGTLLQRAGGQAVQDADDQAQLTSIKRYGAYTKFRPVLQLQQHHEEEQVRYLDPAIHSP